MDVTDADLQLFVSELESAGKTFTEYHARMEQMRQFYKHSVFYPAQAGQAQQLKKRANLLKTFGRKNILYTSQMPLIKVPTTGSSPEQRQAASIREKILYGTHAISGSEVLMGKYAFDGTIYSAAVNETVVDLNRRCVYYKRHNPKRCFWQLSNDGENRIIAFWAVSSITLDEAVTRYNVRPTGDLTPLHMLHDRPLKHIDGKTWFSDVYRWDANTRTHWIGNKFAEVPHPHLLGEIPIDIAMPFNDDDDGGNHGAFYLEDLLELQAELNFVLGRRSAVVKRMSDPAIWARGIKAGKDFDDFKRAMSSGNGGGFLPLAKDGDVGILQLSDTNMLDNHETKLIEAMQRIAGFSAATFGESVGANTSGDALGMYFTPTEKLVANQYITWKQFWRSIHKKTLKAYDRMLFPGEQKQLAGFAPTGTLVTIDDDSGQRASYQQGGFDVAFTRQVINGAYDSQIIPPPVTPKNEIEHLRFWKEAVDAKVVSRTTAFEKMGIENPEQELALLREEQADPYLNPDGMSTLMGALAPKPVENKATVKDKKPLPAGQ